MRLSPFFLTLSLSSTFTPISGDETWIHSPRVTNWGEWSYVGHCPDGFFVNSLILQAANPAGLWKDDVSATGVGLHCTELHYTITNSTSKLDDYPSANWKEVALSSSTTTSNTGRIWTSLYPHSELRPTGATSTYWRAWNSCRKGIAIGFQLRTEAPQGNNVDDSSTNDMQLLCIDFEGKVSSTPPGGDDSYAFWGEWTGMVKCPGGYAVCGISTQTEEYNPKINDNTGLNNVDLLCCPLPNPVQLCTPWNEWELVVSTGVHGSDLNFTVSSQVGVDLSPASSKTGGDQEALIEAEAWTRAEDKLPLIHRLAWNFEKHLSNKVEASYAYERRDPYWKVMQKKGFVNLIKGGCASSWEQLIGHCGGFVVRTNVFRRTDDCAGNEGTQEQHIYKTTMTI